MNDATGTLLRTGGRVREWPKPLRRWPHLLICVLILYAGQWRASAAQDAPRFAGPVEGGYLLPNGWTVTPVGTQVTLTDLPLNIIALADNKHALVASSGYNAHELVLVDLEEPRRLFTAEVRESWFGLASNADGTRVWWSGGGGDLVHVFERGARGFQRVSGPEPTAAEKRAQPDAGRTFRSGLCLAPDGETLYSLDIDAGKIYATPLSGDRLEGQGVLGGRPYDVLVGRNGTLMYVTDWSGRSVLVVERGSLRVVGKISVGEHPNQMVLHPRDDRLFVACASSNSVNAIDTKRGVVIETIHTALFPASPEGSTPDALAISPDGATLFVANADNNCVAVVDVAEARKSQVKGFIPTGWYPTALAVTPDGTRLLVGVGKGNQTQANPIDRKGGVLGLDIRAQVARRGLPYPYIGTTLSGSLSIVPIPDDEQLATYTDRVYRNCPYSDELLSVARRVEPSAIPARVGDPSPIEHVIYIIKENRTYDQVFGDLPRGRGDPALVMFGREVTPNHHKLAEEFVILDNLYANGHVSADGHPWSTMAYHTDYIARNWALTYSRREGVDDDEGELSRTPSGYLWDACARAGLSYRSYGEYAARVRDADGNFRMEGRVPGLVGHVSPRYGLERPGAGEVRDTERVQVFLEEFREYEKNGDLPRLIVMSLGEDHTFGTTPGRPTPQACVASNDLALGRLVEALSHSRYWPKLAIFVIEDDAQNGPDHVDAHRTVGLVISPYAKRKHLDSTQYQTVSMLRTMELILGLPPLSQFDAAATPMYASFSDKADLTPYEHVPAEIDLNARNTLLSFGAERSARMDWSEFDRINDFELNEILWGAIKGADAPIPAPVRRAIAYRSVPIPAEQ